MVCFELKISNFGPATASSKCLSKTILSKKNTFFVILLSLRWLSDVCMYDKSVSNVV